MPTTQYRPPTPHPAIYRTIAQLEAEHSQLQQPAHPCAYVLGERLFLDLHHRLGSHDFTEAIRRLHSQADRNQPPSPETALGAEQLR